MAVGGGQATTRWRYFSRPCDVSVCSSGHFHNDPCVRIYIDPSSTSHAVSISRRETPRLLVAVVMARRQHLTLTVVLGLIVFFSITYFFSGGSASRQLNSGRAAEVPLGNIAKEASSTSSTPGPQTDFKIDLDEIPNLAEGESIAPKLENATLK